MNRLKWIVIGALLCLFSEAGAAGKDWVKYVNTLQGTNSSFELSRGNTYPAVAMPWGMNFWTPQTGENRNGFIYRYAEDIIRGFRQTHQCSPWANDYAAFSLMPVSGELKVTQHNRFRHFRHEDEIAQPHYYKVTLDNRITAEMSPTERGVFMRFTYPEGKDAYVVLDLNKSHNKIKIIPEQRKVVGYTTHASQAVPQGYANYFVIVFDQPIEGYGTWTTDEGKIRPGVAEEEGFFVSGYLKFAPGGQVNARVVSSFISEEQAEENFRQELAGVKDLEEVKAKAAAAWNKQLGKVEVEGGSEEDKATFYSCMYHSMLFPRQFYEYNQAGEPVYYSPYDGKVHKGYMFTDNGFWDTFRAQFPLNLLLHPEMHGRYLKSLLDAYDQSGWLPSWSCPGHSGGMIGNHAFSLLADAWVKGVRTFDPQQALKAMYHDATDKAPFGQSIGRSGWRDYYLKGYVPFGTTSEPTAKTLEYAYNDFCAMRLAQEVGNKTYERFFGKTIFNYRNVYDPESRFMRGRLPNGEWAQKDFDPTAWGGPFIEGNAWQYHWSVMHDIQGLIDLMGGESNFTAKLDSVFSVPNTVKVGTYGRMIHEMTEMMMIDMGQYAHGNQPVHHMIYLYNYAGEPWKTQKWAREVMRKLYNAGPDGYCGDEDQGQMSAWYVISAMGLYAVCPGTDQYVIGSPLFPKMTIHFENGKKLVIEAKNNASDCPYIQSAKLNGKAFTRTWLTFDELTGGGVLRYEMGKQPNKNWGIKPEDRPFSVSKHTGLKKEKTVFQTGGQWKKATDVRADASIVYGVNDRPGMTFEQRVNSWRDRGYRTHFMTGIAWGEYQDYFLGQWDGKKNHLREGQVTQAGDTIWHGHMVPYIVPSREFIEYMKQKHVKRVIDAGIDAIYMEEPEFWARAGYSDAFKEEWQAYYGFPWRAQHESPENTYLANKLKYHLYYRALDEVFTFAKAYGRSKGMDVRCYVPTHSLVNYASWQIVSPEASLASLSCVDGYIAQVWTGTSREATFYNGEVRERVFENAFLEYGSMCSMTAPTGRKMFFLTDPIEDRQKDWLDYKLNYQATFTAQLLYPTIADYEVMPWPDRIYEGLYRVAGTDCRERIPRHYSTQMQVMINTLNDMPASADTVSGSHGIGVLMSNSLMFQRFPNHDGYDDPRFSNFYGQTLPLVKRGIPTEIVHIENTGYPETWKELKVLVMSYSNMKPQEPAYHQYIARWVKNGGVLVYCGKDIDPYQSVLEWWNTGKYRYSAPAQHLFKLLGMEQNPKDGSYRCGKGTVYVIREEPKDFVMKKEGDKTYFNIIKEAYEKVAGKLTEKNNFYLERGPYVIAAVMDESVSDEPLKIEGCYIDLFDPELSVITEKNVKPGEQAFLYDVTKLTDTTQPMVLCGASRIQGEVCKPDSYLFSVKSPANTTNVSRVYLPWQPQEVKVTSADGKALLGTYEWDEKSHTCQLKFENDPQGVIVELK